MGSIQSIIIRPEKKGVPHRINEAKIRVGGIDGDHYAKPEGHRQVTLIAASALATVAASVGFHGDAHIACRRNICVDALPEGDLVGKKVRLGDEVELEITCYCAPCKRMNENFGDGAVDAFENKAGWGAVVLREGEVEVGDPVSIT